MQSEFQQILGVIIIISNRKIISSEIIIFVLRMYLRIYFGYQYVFLVKEIGDDTTSENVGEKLNMTQSLDYQVTLQCL